MISSTRRMRWATVIALGTLFAAATAGAVDDLDAPASTGSQAAGGDDPDLRESLASTHLLRVRRLAPTWRNARMDVLTRSGSIVSGRFRGLNGASLLVVPPDGDPRSVPVRDLERITLKRRPSDLALVGLLAIGVGGLRGGVGALGTDADHGGTATLAGVGAVIGTVVGWKTVYREQAITFD
jgi:hypothetical protein